MRVSAKQSQSTRSLSGCLRRSFYIDRRGEIALPEQYSSCFADALDWQLEPLSEVGEGGREFVQVVVDEEPEDALRVVVVVRSQRSSSTSAISSDESDLSSSGSGSGSVERR